MKFVYAMLAMTCGFFLTHTYLTWYDTPLVREVPVDRSMFGEDWPFTVESGLLGCDEEGRVLFHSEGETYGISMTAREYGYQSPVCITEEAGRNGKETYHKSLDPLLKFATQYGLDRPQFREKKGRGQ